MATNPTKKIFISDIHMSDARSQERTAKLYPYGWFHKNIPKLVTFLTAQFNNPDVAQVVVLGDLFDEWVIPTNQDPLVSFQAICDCPDNSPVVNALKQLAAGGRLTYVPGNHDMVLSAAKPDENQKFVETVFPGINLPDDRVYQSDKLVAEHGNYYCIFNAPDTWTNPSSRLPLGYYMSRLVAYKVNQTGANQDYHDILKKFVLEFKDDPNFIEALFLAIAQDANLNGAAPIDMKGIFGFPSTVGGIASLYKHLIDEWRRNRPDLGWELALIGDIGDLSWAADHTYFSLFGSDKDIVIFGHTHEADLRKHYILAAASGVADIHVDLPCRAIYANSGTWVDTAKPSCTYVETQIDAAAGRHYVRVKAYPDQTLQEGFVRL